MVTITGQARACREILGTVLIYFYFLPVQFPALFSGGKARATGPTKKEVSHIAR